MFIKYRFQFKVLCFNSNVLDSDDCHVHYIQLTVTLKQSLIMNFSERFCRYGQSSSELPLIAEINHAFGPQAALRGMTTKTPVGSVGYLADDIATVRIPMGILTALTGPESSFKWDFLHQRAFDESRGWFRRTVTITVCHLITPLVLRPFGW